MEKRQITGLVVLGSIATTGLGYVVIRTEPEVVLHQLLFFIALFVGLLAWLAVAAYFVSFKLFSRRRYRGNVARSLQHGAVAAAVCVAAAVLQLSRVFTPFAVLLLAGLFVVGQTAVLLRR